MIQVTPITGVLFPVVWGELLVKPSFTARGELRFPYRPSGSYPSQVVELARGVEMRLRFIGTYPVPMDLWWEPRASREELRGILMRLFRRQDIVQAVWDAMQAKDPQLVSYGAEDHWRARNGVALALRRFVAGLLGRSDGMTANNAAMFRLDYFGLESAMMGNKMGGSQQMMSRLEAYAESWNAFRTRYRRMLPRY
jgi:hypothetical protein